MLRLIQINIHMKIILSIYTIYSGTETYWCNIKIGHVFSLSSTALRVTGPSDHLRH